jgi:hypothetical protein
MGEAKQKLSATKKFIREYPDCCFCGAARQSATREHMPPKSVFDFSHRPDKLIMPACDRCNRGTSTADLVAAVVCRWSYINTEQENADHRKLVNQVRRQAPNIVEEWIQPIDRIEARAHLENHGVVVPTDAGMVSIGPLTIQQLNQFAHKFYWHFILSISGHFCPRLGACRLFGDLKKILGEVVFLQRCLN